MDAAEEEEEAVLPIVREILADVVIQDDGTSFVDNYASWVMRLKKLPTADNGRVFVQLAVFAREYAASDCKPVAQSLASLARIGLTRLARGGKRDGQG